MVVTQVDQHVYTGILFSEFNPIEAPKLNEKVLKDKRKKLRETFSRVYRLYVSLPTVKYLFFGDNLILAILVVWAKNNKL